MDYIIEFKKREQYDSDSNCIPKSITKTFDEKATLGEIVDWVKSNAGMWLNDYNILSNPQITGINKSIEVDNKEKETAEYEYDEEPLIHYQEDEGGGWYPCPY